MVKKTVMVMHRTCLVKKGIVEVFVGMDVVKYGMIEVMYGIVDFMSGIDVVSTGSLCGQVQDGFDEVVDR